MLKTAAAFIPRCVIFGFVLVVSLLGCGGGGGGGYTIDLTSYSGIAAGDLNGDGRTDLVMTANSSVKVLLQDPIDNGVFQGATSYPLADGLEFVDIGQINNDNLPDLVISNCNSNTVSVLAQDPAQPGIFQLYGDYGTGDHPDRIASGDLNGDGLADIAAGGSYLTLLYNDPVDPGSFYTGGTLAVVPNFSSVAIADLDGDGRNDLATTGDGVVTLLFQDAAPLAPGSFSVAGTYTAGPNPVDVAVADLDADGKADLAVASYSTSVAQGDASVSVLLQEHDPALRGTFQAAVNYPAGSDSSDVAVGDLNNDGRPDLAVVNNINVSVLLQSATPGVYLPATNLKADIPSRVAIADLNEDGLNDLAIADFERAWIYFQDPAIPGTFRPRVLLRP